MWENNHDIIREWWNTINRHSPTQRRQAAGRQAGSQADVVILDVVAAASQSCSLKAVSQPLRHTTNQPTQRNVDVGLLTPRFLVVTIAVGWPSPSSMVYVEWFSVWISFVRSPGIMMKRCDGSPILVGLFNETGDRGWKMNAHNK